MALPRGATGSLRPTFVPARAVALAVRRACAVALDGPMSDRPEPTVARLRYPLGGDRPSQTARHAGSRFSRSYAGNLPSSFGMVPPYASVCSTGPPVSVSGTVHAPGLFPGPPPQPPQ